MSFFFKKILPLNFFNSLLYTDKRIFHEIRSNYLNFCPSKKNFSWKNFYTEKERLNILINPEKRREKLNSFCTQKNFIFSPFNFLWEKTQEGIWLLENRKKFKETFGFTGPGIYDPFLDYLTLSLSSDITPICQDSDFFQKRVFNYKKLNLSYKKSFLPEMTFTLKNYLTESSGKREREGKCKKNNNIKICNSIFPEIFWMEKKKDLKIFKNKKHKKKFKLSI